MITCLFRSSLAGVMMLLVTLATSAAAADLPCGTAKLVVPWPAGGDTDIIFRAIVAAANRAGAKPQLQVVSSAGQGGVKGSKEVRGAKPDGCTLLALHESVFISHLSGRADFTWDAFQPVALMTFSPSVISANNATPFNDMKGLIAEAKKKPETVTAGVTLGSTTQFIFLLIEDAAGIKLKYVPYDGTRERIAALLTKNIQLGDISIIVAKQYITKGAIKALAIATEERDPSLPNLPTLKEQGINLIYGTNRGIVLPKGAKPEIIAHWQGILAKAARDPSLKKSLEGQGTYVLFLGSADYTALLKKNYSEHEKVAISIGMFKK
ncbi:MAG TPA: tripartite tricarboxylate transporter substrate binding protein [Acidiferrobacterales bacterium]|nr:tripartite tricarboxylate transporter substrate binding protein [Acidiferrobacterales bacterium]